MKINKYFNNFILISILFILIFCILLILLQIGKSIKPAHPPTEATVAAQISQSPPTPTIKMFGNSEFTCSVKDESLRDPIKILVKNGKMRADINGADGKQRQILLNKEDFYVWEKDGLQGTHYQTNPIGGVADLGANPFLSQLQVLTQVSKDFPGCQAVAIDDKEFDLPKSIAFITPADN